MLGAPDKTSHDGGAELHNVWSVLSVCFSSGNTKRVTNAALALNDTTARQAQVAPIIDFKTIFPFLFLFIYSSLR
jgi:hypothetical protein